MIEVEVPEEEEEAEVENFLKKGHNIFNKRKIESVEHVVTPNDLDKDCWHKGKPKCYNSEKFGYAKKDWLVNINHNTNFTEEKQVEGTMFYASQASGTNRDVWYIGSGFSNHMTIKKHMFIEMYPYATPKVKMGNGQVVE